MTPVSLRLIMRLWALPLLSSHVLAHIGSRRLIMSNTISTIPCTATLQWQRLTAKDISTIIALIEECGGKPWGPLSPGDVLLMGIVTAGTRPHFSYYSLLTSAEIDAMSETAAIAAAQEEVSAAAREAYAEHFNVSIKLSSTDVIQMPPIRSRIAALEAISWHRMALGNDPPASAGGWRA
jgi:hypothetical protein